MTSHETEPQKKYPAQRLVGALVLLALAVIIIPMILDFRKGYNVTIDETNIPPQPEDFRVEVLPLIDKQRPEPPVSTAAVAEQAPIVKTPAASDADSKQPEMAQADNMVAPEKSTTASSEGDEKPVIRTARGSKPVIASPPVATPVKPVAKAAPAKRKPAATQPLADNAGKLSKTLPAPSAWVLQVGSFGSKKNAFALRNRLRKNGFRAFVDDIVVDGNKINRVFVGPELVKINTDILQRELKEDMNLKGIVIPYR